MIDDGDSDTAWWALLFLDGPWWLLLLGLGFALCVWYVSRENAVECAQRVCAPNELPVLVHHECVCMRRALEQ